MNRNDERMLWVALVTAMGFVIMVLTDADWWPAIAFASLTGLVLFILVHQGPEGTPLPPGPYDTTKWEVRLKDTDRRVVSDWHPITNPRTFASAGYGNTIVTRAVVTVPTLEDGEVAFLNYRLNGVPFQQDFPADVRAQAIAGHKVNLTVTIRLTPELEN